MALELDDPGFHHSVPADFRERLIGDERWSLVMTYTTGELATVVRQTAIRTGNTLVVLAGSPALVEGHIDKARPTI